MSIQELTPFEQKFPVRQAAVPKIRAHHSAKGPALQVGSLNLRIEHNAIALVAQAIAELDVLDRGLAVTMDSESTEVQEQIALDRTTPCPESGCIFTARDVVIAVHQVFILG